MNYIHRITLDDGTGGKFVIEHHMHNAVLDTDVEKLTPGVLVALMLASSIKLIKLGKLNQLESLAILVALSRAKEEFHKKMEKAEETE